MNAPQPKKLLILNILNILRRYSDESHRLSQKDIQAILARDYDMAVDRKTVKRNLADLAESGLPLEYTEITRGNSGGEPETICTDWYIEREFSDAELRLLIDSILFSGHIPQRQKRSLIQKLEGLSSQYFHSHMAHISAIPDGAPENKQLFYTIEVLDQAIAEKKQVRFAYCEFGTDLKLHQRTDQNGAPKVHTVNPYQIAAAHGKYYLICNYQSHDDVAHVRLDHIADIRLLDTPVRPTREVKGLERGLDLPRHMAEHVYMFPGPSGPVVFRAKRHLVGSLIDWFGGGIRFSEEGQEEVTARVTVNYEAMRRWALQYALHVRILSPDWLADGVREDLAAANERWNSSAD